MIDMSNYLAYLFFNIHFNNYFISDRLEIRGDDNELIV